MLRCMTINKNILVTGSYDSTLISWDLSTQQIIKKIKSHMIQTVTSIDENTFITGGCDGALK